MGKAPLDGDFHPVVVGVPYRLRGEYVGEAGVDAGGAAENRPAICEEGTGWNQVDVGVSGKALAS